MGVGIAAILAAGALASTSGPNPIQAENALPGADPASWIQPAYTATAIQGYSSEASVLPGQTVHLHVRTSLGQRYRVEVYRLGWYGGFGARLLTCLPSCGRDEASRTYGNRDGLFRADWPVTDSFTIPESAPSGYYYALLRVTSPGDDRDARGWVVFIVREPPSHPSQILVQVPVNTWQAYNPWGGKSLYPFNSTDHVHSVRVSFDRPLAYTAQGPFDAEYNLVRFLEREGYDVSYQTDVDTDEHPESLLQHRLVVVAGHDEYWTKTMRDAFDAARDAGTNLAFTGSNAAYWQIRYENDHRTIVGYKDYPDPEPDPALKTELFRQLVPPRPECELMGVMHLRLRAHQSGPVDYTVADEAATDPWFAGTGLAPGDRILDVVGNEWDSLPDPPVPSTCAKPGLTVLFRYAGPPADADAVRYTAPSGARVFSGGAQQLSWPLDTFDLGRFGRTLAPDPRFQQFIRNVFADLRRPAAPAEVKLSVRKRTVRVRVGAPADPRVKLILVLRHRGALDFQVGDAGVVRVCASSTSVCMQRNLRPGKYRWAAVAVDQWGQSAPSYSRAVVIRRGR
jgi:hypothetical protein